jgi:alanine racemase
MGTIGKIFNKIASPRIDYQPLIEVRVFKDALLHNLKTFQQKYPSLRFAPVIKSNAYGHGMVEVAKILEGGREDCTMPFFMVDSFYEALVLRRAGIKTKILVLGYCRQEQLLSANLKDVSFGIIDLRILKNLSANLKKPLNIHLKIDTGMHRQGILASEADEAIKVIRSNKNIILEGICSHFADADNIQKDFTQKQIEVWNKTVKIFRSAFPEIKFFHTSATSGAYYASNLDANVGRLGIGLYGINQSPHEPLDLHPALEMVSLMSSIRNIPAGEKVGYGKTFESSKPTIVATVPVGYNEGVDRRLSNRGCFKVRDTFCPIAGRVSMNITSIDVSDIPNIKIEELVVVISSNKTDKNSVENLAKLCDCISYEILVHIPQHLRRVIV